MIKIFKIYKNMSVQVKAALWFTICSVLQKGISFITVPVFTRLLTSEQYGTYSLYMSWLQILSIITSLYLYYGVFNNAMVKFEDNRDEYISSMQGLTITITTIIFATILFLPDFWSRMLGLSTFVIVIMFLEMYVTPAFQFWAGKNRFEYKYRRLVGVSLSLSFLNPALGLVFVFLSEDRGTARISAAVLADCIVCGVILFFQFRRGKKFFVKEYWCYCLKLAIPLLPHYLSGMILNQGDRIMIDRMIGKSEVAFYSIAYSIGMLAQIVTSAVINSFTPWMYLKIKGKESDEIKGTINVLLLIVSLAAAGLMLMAPELISIFGSKEYADAVYVIPPVVASVYFIFLYNLLAIPQFYYEKTQFLMISSIVAALLNIGLNYVFILKYGYYAAGYTTLVCYMLYSLGHYFVSTRMIKRQDINVRFFDVSAILLISAVLAALCLLSNFLFDKPVIRVLFILAICAGCIVKRNYLINLLKNLRSKD